MLYDLDETPPGDFLGAIRHPIYQQRRTQRLMEQRQRQQQRPQFFDEDIPFVDDGSEFDFYYAQPVQRLSPETADFMFLQAWSRQRPNQNIMPYWAQGGTGA